MKRNAIIFTLLIAISCIGCDAGKPRSKASGTARTALYSIGGGVVQAERQGFSIFFLIEGVTPEEYNAKAKSVADIPVSPFKKPKEIYDFDPEEIAELKKEYNELLADPSSDDSRSESAKRMRKVDSTLFFAVAEADRDYKAMVSERESAERNESTQKRTEQDIAGMKIAEDFVRSGKKCTTLVISWNLNEGHHPTQDIGPDHGIADQQNNINFDFPLKDSIFFDLLGGKVRLGTQSVAGLPPADGKCYILNSEMKFVPIDVQTPELLSKFIASTSRISEILPTFTIQTKQSPADANNKYMDCTFVSFPVPVDKIPWTNEILSSVNANRLDLYEAKFSWEAK